MRIILIRHGDPNYEKDCLTELGHKQAAAAAQRLLSEGIDEIYSSPQGRAFQTAEYFSKASGIKDIHILDFIREIRYGREGELYDDKWHPWKGADQLMLKERKINPTVFQVGFNSLIVYLLYCGIIIYIYTTLNIK